MQRRSHDISAIRFVNRDSSFSAASKFCFVRSNSLWIFKWRGEEEEGEEEEKEGGGRSEMCYIGGRDGREGEREGGSPAC